MRLNISILSSEKRSSHYTSLPAVFNPLPTSTNREAFEKKLCNQSSQYEKYGKFSIMKRKPSHATTKSTLLSVSKDKWNTRRALVSPQRMHCMYCGMPKGTSWAEVMSKNEKKNQAP